MTDTVSDEVDLSMANYYYEKHFWGRRAEIEEELRVALNAYMVALDDPQAKSEALIRFDASLVRLRDVYREADWGCEGPPRVVQISVGFSPSNPEELFWGD